MNIQLIICRSTLLLLTMPAVLSPGKALADDPSALTHQCTRQNAQLRIDVISERAGEELPCQVVVTPSSGERQTLWRARFERGFCVGEADAKRDRLERDGWRCETSARTEWAKTTTRHGAPAEQSDRPATGEDTRQKVLDGASSFDLERFLLEASPDKAVVLSLEEAVSLALRNNRDIEGVYLNRRRDALFLEQAEDQFRPDLTIEASPNWRHAEGTSGELSSSLSTSLPTGGEISMSWVNALSEQAGTATFSGELTQPLLRGGGLDANLAGLRGARLNFDSSKLAMLQTVSATVTQVISAHRALNLAQIEIDVADRALERAVEQKSISEKLFDAGRIPRLDLVQNDADISRRKVDVSAAQLALENAHRDLLQLLDVETRAMLFAEPSISKSEVDLDLDTALDIAFSTRPDFLGAELGHQAIKLGLDVAKSEERWGLDAVVGADYEDSIYERENGFGRVESDINYRAGLRLTIPFGDVERRHAVQLANLDIRESDLSLVELTESIETEVANLIANIDTLKDQILLAERAETLAQDQLAAERSKFSRGFSSTLDVIRLEDELIDAELTTLRSKVDYSEALAALDQALGTTLQSWAIDVRDER
jgi:outer membrane protein TolC